MLTLLCFQESTEQLSQHVIKLTVLVSQLCTKSGEPNPLEQKTWLTNKTLRQEPPWVIKMMGLQEKKMGDVEWYSDPVYSHFGGYKMHVMKLTVLFNQMCAVSGVSNPLEEKTWLTNKVL